MKVERTMATFGRGPAVLGRKKKVTSSDTSWAMVSLDNYCVSTGVYVGRDVDCEVGGLGVIIGVVPVVSLYRRR